LGKFAGTLAVSDAATVPFLQAGRRMLALRTKIPPAVNVILALNRAGQSDVGRLKVYAVSSFKWMNGAFASSVIIVKDGVPSQPTTDDIGALRRANEKQRA
jgi:hypothetical protein